MNDRILILYATVTGNAEICANNTAKRLQKEGFTSVVKDVLDVSARELETERLLLLCVSTYGEGDPPDAAAPLWEELVRAGNFDLSNLRFSVLALGDSSYTEFCKCGKDFDAAIERQGGRRLAPRIDCDVDYEKPWARWIESVVAVLKTAAVPTNQANCTTA